MRARSVRLTVLILVILGLALASLGFNNVYIKIPGFPALERGGSGPLGLKLGLDLRGGGHLVYQADTGTRVDVVFPVQAPSRTIIGTGEVVVEPGKGAGQDTPDAPPDQPVPDAATGGDFVSVKEAYSTWTGSISTVQPGGNWAPSKNRWRLRPRMRMCHRCLPLRRAGIPGAGPMTCTSVKPWA